MSELTWDRVRAEREMERRRRQQEDPDEMVTLEATVTVRWQERREDADHVTRLGTKKWLDKVFKPYPAFDVDLTSVDEVDE